MYKALIADIDGTLVPIRGDGSTIDKATIAAVSEALKIGAQISVATGRGWASTKPVVEKLGIVDLCIIEGGSSIIDPSTEELVWKQTIDADTSELVVEVFKQHSGRGEMVKSSTKPERIPVTEADAYHFENRVIYLLGTDQVTATRVKHAIDAIPNVAANVTTPSWAGERLYDVHVTNKYGTKRYALDEWFRRMNLSGADTIAMGDSANDLPLFENVAVSVAVGNATSELKGAADFLAPAMIHGALKEVIDKYLLNT